MLWTCLRVKAVLDKHRQYTIVCQTCAEGRELPFFPHGPDASVDEDDDGDGVSRSVCPRDVQVQPGSVNQPDEFIISPRLLASTGPQGMA